MMGVVRLPGELRKDDGPTEKAQEKRHGQFRPQSKAPITTTRRQRRRRKGQKITNKDPNHIQQEHLQGKYCGRGKTHLARRT